jgi:glutathione S-transferase
VLVAKNVAFEEREPPGGYRSDTYRQIVPMGTLPAIVDDGLVLSESEAINEYLEERFPLPAMLPQDPQQRAMSRFLSRFHDLYLEPPVRALFGQVAPVGRDAALVAARVADIRKRVAQLAELSSPRPFLAAETLTLADCGPAVTLPLAQMLLTALGQRLDLPPAIAAWQQAVQAHAAVAQVLAPWRAATDNWLNSRLAA